VRDVAPGPMVTRVHERKEQRYPARPAMISRVVGLKLSRRLVTVMESRTNRSRQAGAIVSRRITRFDTAHASAQGTQAQSRPASSRGTYSLPRRSRRHAGRRYCAEALGSPDFTLERRAARSILPERFVRSCLAQDGHALARIRSSISASLPRLRSFSQVLTPRRAWICPR
jgi:hypothetical protein